MIEAYFRFPASQDAAVATMRAARGIPVVTVDSATQGVAIGATLRQGGLGTVGDRPAHAGLISTRSSRSSRKYPASL